MLQLTSNLFDIATRNAGLGNPKLALKPHRPYKSQAAGVEMDALLIAKMDKV